MMTSKSVATPIEQNHILSETLGEKKWTEKCINDLLGDSFILHILGQT